MASSASTRSSRSVLLPSIPELFNPNFLDVLVPEQAPSNGPQIKAQVGRSNPMIDALKSTIRRVLTENLAPAYSGTDSETVNAFSGINRYTTRAQLDRSLQNSWKEDANLTLKIIWNLRSIHDGKGEKETFYRAFGWLYNNHPRTAISNLNLLVEPVCDAPKKKRIQGMSHGYWKDLLNILALETVGELRGGDLDSSYLHHPRMDYNYRKRCRSKVGTPESRLKATLLADARAKEVAAKERKKKNEQFHDRLLTRLKEPRFRALFIAVARLFAEQLLKDIRVLDELNSVENRIALLKTLSLAGKWAPTPGGSHDRVTSIATAICELIYASGSFTYPSILKTSISDEERARVLLSFYQRWILTELRRALSCPEPLMSANRWTEIKYNFIPSICMKNNQEHFLKHDPDGFEKYLTAVESGEKTISGATLLPHELVAQAVARVDRSRSKSAAIQKLKKKIALSRIRVVEAQWKTLISNLREAGSIENSIAVCDVSGSMGSIYQKYGESYVAPILPAVSLSLVLASLAKPPFNGGFITFSANPKYEVVDPDEPLTEQIAKVLRSDWGMNTNISSVFIDLLLPLAVGNNIKQEDMIKRLFVFSDMQFDAASGTRNRKWFTNYDAIEQAYKKAGYEVPQIVYWDLAAAKTKEVDNSRKRGIAMMNGFSPAMLKVFMGEEEEAPVDWGKVEEDGSVTMVEKDSFDPYSVMLKALTKKSFDGLVVID